MPLPLPVVDLEDPQFSKLQQPLQLPVLEQQRQIQVVDHLGLLDLLVRQGNQELAVVAVVVLVVVVLAVLLAVVLAVVLVVVKAAVKAAIKAAAVVVVEE